MMRNKRILRELTHLDPEHLPDDLRRRLEKNPAFRAEFERLRNTTRLVGLKRYEHPAPGVLDVVRADIMRSIRLLDSKKASQGWLTSPALRYGLATVFLGLLGIHLISASLLPPAGPIPWGADVPLARTQPRAFPSTELNPPSSPLLASNPWIYQAGSSNVIPSAIHYGGLPSAVVEFDY
jgi:hypothetical protein